MDPVALVAGPQGLVVAGQRFVWRFPATVVRWVDGDTVVAHVALSPKLVQHEEHVRLDGVNAPELNASAADVRANAARAKALVSEVAPPGSVVTVEVQRVEKYGRLLGRVVLADGRDVGGLLVEAGLAVVAA